jgi:hypothetical protein
LEVGLPNGFKSGDSEKLDFGKILTVVAQNGIPAPNLPIEKRTQIDFL